MASELKVNTITEATSGSGITFAKDIIPATPLSHRNMIINGAMQVYQRGSLSITQTNNGGFALDRFKYSQGAAVGQWVGTMTQDTLSDADIVTTGQRNALKVLTTTVENAVGADEDSRIVYVVEAQDCQRLLYGTSAASSATLSFWAKSTVAANYAVNIWQEDGNDTITKTYTLAANTWTRVSITIPGNTLSGGVIANDNTGGLWIQFMLIAGSDMTSSDATSWGTYSAAKLAYGHTASSVSNPWGTNASDAWYITGVQLELGSVATPFEHRSYADEFRMCERYYQKLTGSYTQYGQIANMNYNSANQAQSAVRYRTEMRAAPTLSYTSTSSNNSSSAYAIANGSSGLDFIDTLFLYNPNTISTLLYTGNSAGGTAREAGNLYVNSTITELALVAELS